MLMHHTRLLPLHNVVLSQLRSLGALLLSTLLLAACSSEEPASDAAGSKSIPQGIVAKAGTRAVELSWSGVAGSDAYTVYWSNQPGVTPRTGVAVSTDTPTLEHVNLSNGVRYYYIVTSKKASSESSPSQEVSSVPFAAVPEAPTAVVAQAGAGRVALSWQPVAGASRFSVYWRNSAGVSESDTRIDNAISPLVHSDLENGLRYHYIVVAENAQGSGATSIEVQATPAEPIPTAPVMSSAIVNADDVQLHWQDVSVAANSSTEYDLYWNSVGNVTTADAQIRGVTSPYRHAPLATGQDYYYRVQARNSSGASGLSNSVHVQPPNIATIDSPAATLPSAPTAISIGPGDGQLNLSWPAVANASAYNLYWTDSASELLLQDNPQISKISNIQSPYTHIQLTNGTNYRYVLSAINDAGESALSVEKSASPELVKPGVPAGVYASGGDEFIALRWLAVDQARDYIVYVTDVASGNEQIITPATSPIRIDAGVLGTALLNGAVYRVEVAAINVSATSLRSAAVEVIPQEPPPRAPSQLTAEPGDAQVVLRWLPGVAQDSTDPDEIVTAHQVYYSTLSGVTALNGTPIPAVDGAGQANYQAVTDAQGNAAWQLRHSGLSNGQRYYYIVTAKNIGGESASSEQMWARPQVPIAAMPNNIWAQAGNNRVLVHFSEAVSGGVVSYNLYWSKAINDDSGLSRSATQVITNILPGYEFQDGTLSNGNTYYFRLSTVNAAGESGLSAEVSATPQVPPPQSAPQNVLALGQQSQVTLSWTPVVDADAYVLYWSTESDIDTTTSARISGAQVQSGFVHSNLLNGQAIYYQLSAVNAGGESALSALAVAMPQWDAPAKPNNVVLTAGDTDVLVNWPLVATATSYTLYWHADPINNDPLSNWSSQSVLPGARITGLSNGKLYHMQLEAINAGGASVPSDVISVMPELSVPASPLGLSAASGESQVSLNWSTRLDQNYTLYWTSDPNLANRPIDSGNQINAVRPTYVHTGLSNGSVYRYQLTASHRDPITGANIGVASVPTVEVTVTPAATIASAPQALRALSADSEVSLSWLPPATGTGPYSYNLYWSNTAGQATNATAITDISNTNYRHGGLSNNQTYYYVVTATTIASGLETAASLATSATPQGQAPGQVLGVWVAPGDGQNLVSWQPDTRSTQYQVEWSTQVDANNALQGTINSSLVIAPSVQFQHTSLTNGETIYYRIGGQNNNGAAGSLLNGLVSATVSGTPQSENNQLPQIQQGSLVTVTMDEDSTPTAFELNLSAIDNDGDSLSWSIGNVAPRGSAAVIASGASRVAVTYIPIPDDNGTDQFSVLVDDGRGGVDSITVDVIITPSNDVPVFNASITDQSNVNGALIAVDASATDIDSTNLAYSATGLPAGLSINANTGEISGTLSSTASANSPYSVTLTVNDQDPVANATVTLSLSWVVTTVSADPSFSTVSILPSTASVEAGTTVVITVNARDSNNNPIATGGESVALTIVGANAAGPLPATDNNDGTYTVSYQAQLVGVGSDTYLLTLNQATIAGSYSKIISPAVADAGTSVAQIPAGPYTAGAAVTLGAIVRDAFGNASTGNVIFEITDAAAQTTTLAGVAQGAGLYSLTYTPTLVGSDSITVKVDNGVLAGSPFTRSINASTASAANSNATIPAGPYTAGQAVTLAAQINDASGNPTAGFVTFTIVDAAAQSTSVTGLAQGGGLYQIAYTPTLVGTETITPLVDGVAISASVSRIINPDIAVVTNSSVTINPADPLTAGATVNIELQVVDANLNLTTATSVVMTVAGANVQPLPLVIGNPSVGIYTASYSALKSGVDTYTITVNNTALTTPLTRTINADVASVADSSVTVTPTDPVTAGDIITVALQVRDANLNLTAAVVTIDVTGANAPTLPLAILNPALGNYSVSYTANNAGVDNYAVTIDAVTLISADLTRTINAANVAPSDITLTNLNIAENSATDVVIGSLGAVDANTGDTHSYRFAVPNTDDAGGRFSIVGNNLQVANGALLDFETNTTHLITIEVADQGGLTFSRDFTIVITDVNDVTPVITNVGLTPSIPENSTAIVALTIDDVDTGNAAFVYTLTGPDAAQFEVVANNLQFKAASIPDFEVPADVGLDNIYDLSVTVNDGINNSVAAIFTVTVSDVNDIVPVITNNNVNPSIPENSTAVTTLVVSDNDTVNAAFSYTLSGADAAHFEVVADSLQFKATSIPDFEIPADDGLDNIYDLAVTVNDGVNDSVGTLFTVTVTNVVESGTVYYVKATALNDNGDGLTVATAKKTIPAAIAAATAPATIRVSSGTYFVNSDTRNAVQTHIVLKNGVSLYGGYTLDFAKRLPASQISIIQDISSETRLAPLSPTRTMEGGSGITPATVIDGFTIRGTTNSLADYTSAINLQTTDAVLGMGATFQNNIIYGGSGNAISYGFLIERSSPVIQYNRINGGAGAQTSYGIRNNNHAPVIQYNTISGGAGGSSGGLSDSSVGIYDSGFGTRINNNTIVAGCGVSCVNSYGIEPRNASNLIIEDNTIYGGRGSSKSAGILNALSYSIIRRNLIYGGNGAAKNYGIDMSTLGSATESLSVINNVIHGGAGTNSYGINNFSQSEHFIRNNIIDGGSGSVTSYGVLNNSPASNPTVENNIIYSSGLVSAYCFTESGISSNPKSMRNNTLFGCSTSAYFDTAAACTSNLDGDGNSATCTVAEMETLTDFTNGVSGNLSVDPLFVDKDGYDNDITTLEDNDWRFSGISPVSVTAGGLNGIDNGGWGYTLDKDGATRPATGVAWAMGAYDTTATYYVSLNALDDSGDGRTPATAKLTIPAAIAAATAPAIVRVTYGTFRGNSNAGIDTHVILKEGVSLIGGHALDFSVRPSDLFNTQIADSGGITSLGSPSKSVEAGAGITPATVVEGFDIIGSGRAGVVYSAGVYTKDGSPTLRHNYIQGGGGITNYPVYAAGTSKIIIRDNYLNGGESTTTATTSTSYGVYADGASPYIYANRIAATTGIRTGLDSEARIENNLIRGVYYGLVNRVGHPVVRNNTIYASDTGNGFNAYGIYSVDGAMPVIENNIIHILIATINSVCISSPTGQNPASVRNNDLVGCATVYFSKDPVCGVAGNLTGACTLTEMESLIVFGLSNATGNISVDPLLVDFDGPDNGLRTMPDNDWHLQATSPVSVREGGLDLSAETFDFDHDRNTRTAIINGVPTEFGSGWSIGAYEQD